jgi:hypothetical protein
LSSYIRLFFRQTLFPSIIMVNAAIFAALLAIFPTVFTEDVTGYSIRCATRYGYAPLTTGTVHTHWKYITTTNTICQTSVTHETITETPAATSTCFETTTEKSTILTTTTITPSPTYVPTPAGFKPLFVVDPTPIPRVKRLALGAGGVFRAIKRQTWPGYVAGFIAYADGTDSDLYKIYPHVVDCNETTIINTTRIDVVTGTPVTILLTPATAIAMVTKTLYVTNTVTEVIPQATIYAACARNNVGKSQLQFLVPKNKLTRPQSIILRTTTATG